MEQELKRHYSLLVEFLGHILGPDYEIALHELKDDSNQIIAIANGELTGLLCINFDSSRYEELAGKVMDLCGGKLMPGTESGTSLIVDRELPSAGPAAQAYPTSIAGATASIVSSVVANYPVEVDRLTQDEKMDIMETLSRKGVFLLKGSVSYVAKELHSSEASIYRYLGKLNSRQK